MALRQPRRAVAVAGFAFGLLVVGMLYLWEPLAIAFWSWRARTADDLERHVALIRLKGLGRPAIRGVSLGLKHVNPIVRFDAAMTLGEMRHPESVAPLVGALVDRSPMVQCMAARSLAAIGDPRATPALLELLAGQNGYVRFETALALERLGNLAGVPAIIDKLGNPRLGLTAEARLAQLAQRSYGRDKAAWRQWWAEEGPKRGYGVLDTSGESPRAEDVAAEPDWVAASGR